MRLILAVDFGSTYTKVVAVDLEKEEVVAVVQAPTTVESNATLGLDSALLKLKRDIEVENLEPERFLCCSSAAGGLRMVVAGLVPELTTKAAQKACLGAGARVVASYSNGLIKEDMDRIEEIAPDILLLAGGTDGGNKAAILENARIVGDSRLEVPVIMAGNRTAASEVRSILDCSGKVSIVVENILPQLDKVNVKPARMAIRDTYISHIINAKGLDRAREIVGDIIMPTPAAVLNAVTLLAEGTEQIEGLGELIVVDIGGATTDVHSVAKGSPANPMTIIKGLPEPHRKRTVEGDLGLHHNAELILELVGKQKILALMPDRGTQVSTRLDLTLAMRHLSRDSASVAPEDREHLLDIGLASAAVEVAMKRHSGNIEELYLPTGKALVQRGKDLTGVKYLIGTGGVFGHVQMPGWILKKGCFDETMPDSLRPIDPDLFIDDRYIMFAIGLLAEEYPDPALKIIKQSLRKVENPNGRKMRRE